jgi:hypothetical protein
MLCRSSSPINLKPGLEPSPLWCPRAVVYGCLSSDLTTDGTATNRGTAGTDICENGVPVRQAHYAVTENRMRVGITAFGVHQHGLTESLADRLEECAEDIEPFLTLYLTEVDVEVDLRRVVEAEDCEHVRSRPDAKGSRLGIRLTTEHRFRTG